MPGDPAQSEADRWYTDMPYPLPYGIGEDLYNEVDRMLEIGVMRPLTSPYVSKKNCSNRVCVDFRKLNKITEVNPEPQIH